MTLSHVPVKFYLSKDKISGERALRWLKPRREWGQGRGAGWLSDAPFQGFSLARWEAKLSPHCQCLHHFCLDQSYLQGHPEFITLPSGVFTTLLLCAPFCLPSSFRVS